MRALFSWFLPTQVFEPTGAELIKAMKLSGYRGPGGRPVGTLPNAEIRRRAVAAQNVHA